MAILRGDVRMTLRQEKQDVYMRASHRYVSVERAEPMRATLSVPSQNLWKRWELLPEFVTLNRVPFTSAWPETGSSIQL
jgi:hypothetical protein